MPSEQGKLMKPGEKVAQVRDLLISRRSEIERALPKHLDADRLLRVALNAIGRNPRLMECTVPSLYRAIMRAAEAGLEPDGVTGEAYLIPYKNHGIMEAQFQPGYRGLAKLARNSGSVKKIWARCVFENDQFAYQLGTTEYVKHNQFEGDDPGKLRAVYACADYGEGFDPAMVILWPRDVMKRKALSRSAKFPDSPWQEWEPEMWQKTAAIALCKLLPLTSQIARIIAEAEDVDRNEPIEIEALPLDMNEAAEHAVKTLEQTAASTRGSKMEEAPAPRMRSKAEQRRAPVGVRHDDMETGPTTVDDDELRRKQEEAAARYQAPGFKEAPGPGEEGYEVF